ncbi:MAG: penicillin-binding protein 2 [Candidatus Arcticimaribacter sp.]|nr:penicillin-binding protein 2 [Flavobacteriaceae bacterium]MDB9910662.1 penicillin-binding protein 2 [Flavobacteriaceae bacterium]PSR10152.1 MAG: penicillin-binding protein 2 [Candidatus Arcticimaribacter sp.]PTL99189.1 MAG: penicillin-binding protein 2 [Candidatus Arcticimaribacter sp.]
MRKLLLAGLTLIIGILFISRLFQLQVVNTTYQRLSDNNAILEISDYPERGFIYDRNGKLLVANQAAYDIMIIPENVIPFDTLSFCELTGVSKERLIKSLKKARRYSKRLPSVIVNQISKETYATLQEQMWKYEGFFIQKKSLRDYRIGFGANVLGYVSEVNNNDLKYDDYYQQGELIGRQGIEKSYENELRGEKGKRFLQKDRFNRIIGEYKNKTFDVEPKVAKDINLTLDALLQEYGEYLMQNKRGGIVAIEPSTGEILALVSAPSYNPNLLVGRNRSKNYRKLAQDTLAKPLFDRGLQALYPPGSPFKTLNALIALQEGVITPETQFKCNKGHFYARGAFMECHCRRGSRNDLLKGIYQSCNTYFANTYKKIINKYDTPDKGVNQWNSHLKSFGLGNYLGYDLSVGKRGFIPNAAYYNSWYKEGGWKAPTIISNAIGQGEVLTTPIQLANFTAAIANRGYYYTPHFLRSVSGDSIKQKFLRKNTSIDPEHFEVVIDGMHKVVEKGTARIARIKGIEVCGKTGTAENFTKIDGVRTQLTDHSIFIAFAPKEDPKIAIAVFIENGYWGGRWAAPIASLMLEQYINKEVKRSWLEKRMVEGSLATEYEKPYSGKPFTINE